MEDTLSQDERKLLLKLAREALTAAVNGRPMPGLDLGNLTPMLQQDGVTFVTLTRQGQLRGCIGALKPKKPLAEDVRDHAVAAGMQDFRFPVVKPDELPHIDIEISRLTHPKRLDYETPQDLLSLLRPGKDGVIIRDSGRRATFLPQVWQKIPGPEDFLSQLCTKMGASPNLWREKRVKVQIYQVEEFHE